MRRGAADDEDGGDESEFEEGSEVLRVNDGDLTIGGGLSVVLTFNVEDDDVKPVEDTVDAFETACEIAGASMSMGRII
jgi:hypothetical protein